MSLWLAKSDSVAFFTMLGLLGSVHGSILVYGGTTYMMKAVFIVPHPGAAIIEDA
jgi:hypothetical protein